MGLLGKGNNTVMKLTLLFTVLLLSAKPCLSQPIVNDTIYLDKDWNPCVKEQHHYFRVITEDNTTMAPERLFKVKDYYRSGKMQMEGYLLAADSSIYKGLYKWYDKKGRLKDLCLYDYAHSKPYFAELNKYTQLLEPCDTTNTIFSVHFFKRGQVHYLGFYKTDIPSNAKTVNTSERICTWKRFNQFNKDIVYLYEYENGALNGRCYTYRSKGRLWKEKYYANGHKTGTWKFYKADGTLKKTKKQG